MIYEDMIRECRVLTRIFRHIHHIHLKHHNNTTQTDEALRGRSLHYLGSDYLTTTKELQQRNPVSPRDSTVDEASGSIINLKSKIFNVFGYSSN